MKVRDFLFRWLGWIIMFLRNMVNPCSLANRSYPVLTMSLLAEKYWGIVRSGKIEGKDGLRRFFFVEIDSRRIPADICSVPDKETIGLIVLANMDGKPEFVEEIIVWDAMDADVAQHLKEGCGAIEFICE